MIPKLIHYCWFGGAAKPPIVNQCIDSWRKMLPDYTIQEWNESNYDVSAHPYTRGAYQAKKWAFVSDYARLDILYQHGGIYFDTDVEVLKSFDCFLQHQAFCGMETTNKVATGLVIGAEPHNPMIQMLRADYDSRTFLRPDGSLDMTPCPMIQTDTLIKMGFVEEQKIQEINGLVIYPASFFCPRTPGNHPVKTPEAYSVHYYAGMWQSPIQRLKKSILGLLGENIVYLIKLKRFLLHGK